MERTVRGFDYTEFKDMYGECCSLQKSSLATEDAIWLGVNNPQVKILSSKITEGATGWTKLPVPEGVEINGRMHLNQEQVAALIPVLQRFVVTGDIGEKEMVAVGHHEKK
jgi:hypothetical protein